MAVLGDRAVAALLSALAEASDYQAAASFLLAQIIETTGATRACTLRLDSAHVAINVVACGGFDPEPVSHSLPISDLSNPLIIGMLAGIPIKGSGGFGPRAFDDLGSWCA